VSGRSRCPFDAAAFDAAVARYRDKFGGAALPVVPGVCGAGGPGGEAAQVAVGMLRRAAATDEPLDRWAVVAALGIRRPPDGPVH
jgi:hypothetical protein